MTRADRAIRMRSVLAGLHPSRTDHGSGDRHLNEATNEGEVGIVPSNVAVLLEMHEVDWRLTGMRDKVIG